MSEAELEQLERDVEQARSRVAVDLARLRAPGAMAELKDDVAAQVSRTKDQLLDRTRAAVRERSDNVVSEVKARIAANPGAALAIGAGLLWKFYRRPPVTSVLVGAGIMGLMRTDPHHPAIGSDTAARAAELAGAARAKAEEWRHGGSAARIGEQVEEARNQLGSLAESAGERVEEARSRLGSLAETAGERIGALADAAREQVGGLRSQPRGTGGNGSSRHVGPPRSWPGGEMPAPPVRREARDRDRYLLGAAAFAMAAAIGIAAQRRFAGPESASKPAATPRRVPVRSGPGRNISASG